MITAIMFALGFAVMLFPALAPVIIKTSIGMIPTIVIEFVGVIIVVIAGYFAMFKKFYRIALSNQSLIRTGGIGKSASTVPTVAIGSGLWCIPMIHMVRTFEFCQHVFTIEKRGDKALQCHDGRLADVRATFKVSVPQTSEAVLKFVAAAGHRDPNSEETYKQLCFDTLETAMRDACTSKAYMGIYEGREQVANEIENSVKDDFSKIGLQLDTAKLPDVDPTDIVHYDENNPQHAVGRTAITMITQDQKLATREKELTTQESIRAKEVDNQKRILTLDQEQKIAESEQAKQVAIQQALNERESKEKTLEQEELIGKREIAKELAVGQERVGKDKQIALATQQKDREVAEGDVAKNKAVELATRDQQIAIANKETEKASAEADRLAAEKLKVEAEQAVLTANKIAEAERDKQRAVIEQQASSERLMIQAMQAANAEAYKVERDAQAKKTAADAELEAKQKAAAGELAIAENKAKGDAAVAMVPIDVDRRKVEVEQARVDVLKQELQAKSENSQIAMGLEIQIATIKANQAVGEAFAKAMGEAYSAANITIWGDADTPIKMTQAFTNGQMSGNYMAGLLESTPKQVVNAAEDLKDGAVSAMAGLGAMVSGLAKKYAGLSLPDEQVKSIVSILEAAAKVQPMPDQPVADPED